MEDTAPITYSTLHAYHLPQIHDLLDRSFWHGINGNLDSKLSSNRLNFILSVRDSLDYSPEKATMVAMYKKIVVGVAILSSPRETYITYLAVKAGWDKAQIGRLVVISIVLTMDFNAISPRTMLYHLISLNPHKDITLHVSVNSSAMVSCCISSHYRSKQICCV